LTKLRSLLEINKGLIFQIIRYGLVGIVNTLVGYGIYFLFLYVGLNYTIALTFGSICGIICSYFLNRFWTFKSTKKVAEELPKFLSVYGVSYFLNLGLLILFVEKFKIDARIAQLFILVIITCLTFIGNKFWSFRNNKKTRYESEG
jgi:putative flippase GtrA